MSASEPGRTVQALLARHGTTYAEDAGISLSDEPGPLWQLAVLTLLLSAPIRAEAAVATARELFRSGCGTPHGTRSTSRRARVAALGRGGYRRYDERTATRLGDLASCVLDEHAGDLRRLRERGDVGAVERALQGLPGIGPGGTAVFLREVQGTWPELAPYVDRLAATGAEQLGLPTDPAELAALVPVADLPRLTAACVRVARGRVPVADLLPPSDG